MRAISGSHFLCITELSNVKVQLIIILKISFYIRLNLLEFRRELVEGVLLHHHFHFSKTVFIASHFGACLLGMDSPIPDFILPDIAKGIADTLHQRANHQVEKMMTLYI